MRPQLVGRSRARVARHRDSRQQQDFAFVSVVDERSCRKRVRRGPLDRADANAIREPPGDRGRQAGIARVAPIVCQPSAILSRSATVIAFPGYQRGAFRDELRLDVIGLHRRRSGRVEGERRRQCQRAQAPQENWQ